MMRHSTKTVGTTLLMLVGFIALCRPAYCWDKFAHQIIAQIAYDRLIPTAKAKVDAIIAELPGDDLTKGLNPKYLPYNPVTAAAFMDDIKEETHDFNTWHYIDLPDDPNLSRDQVAYFQDRNPSNAYQGIVDWCLPPLSDPKVSNDKKARLLAFLLHLEGDIHQPLHAIGRDRGGNSWSISGLPQFDPTWELNNLHAFWDNAYRYGANGNTIIVVDAYNDLPRIAKPGDQPVKKIADVMMKKYPPSAADSAISDPAVWAVESNHIATSFAFPQEDTHTLSADYVTKAHDIACHRITLAGVRLAKLLNKLFGQ